MSDATADVSENPDEFQTLRSFSQGITALGGVLTIVPGVLLLVSIGDGAAVIPMTVVSIAFGAGVVAALIGQLFRVLLAIEENTRS